MLPILAVATVSACLSLEFEEPAAGQAPNPDNLNILFIGNSLTTTNLLPSMVEALIDSAGLGPIEVRTTAASNYGLGDHWFDGDATDEIELGGWDYVVIQQGPSATEGRPSLLEYSGRFGEVIRTSGAVPALYMVWPSSARAMDWDGVKESYQMAATEAQGIFLPAGEAWRVAWESDSTLQFYGTDGFHPTILGTYLAALVIVEQLSGASPIGLPARFHLGSDGPVVAITPEKADSLQVFAQEANARERQSPLARD